MNNAEATALTQSQYLTVLRTVFDNSPDLVYVLNPELRVVLCNATFRRLCKNTEPEGMHLLRLEFSPEAIAEHRLAFAAYAENGHSWCQDIEIIMSGQHYSGCTVISVESLPLLVFHLRDTLVQHSRVTPIHNQGLLLAHDLFKRVTEGSSDLIAAVDRDLRYSMFNDAFREELRRLYHHDVKVGDSVAEASSRFPQHQELLLELFQRALQDEIVQHIMEVGEGTERRFFNMRFYPLRDREGRITGAGQIALDVTEQMRAEAALKESEQRFRTVADNISQLVWMANAQGQVLWFNQRWREFTGTTPIEMKGLGWRRVIHPDHIKRVTARLQHSWDTGEVWEDVFPMKSKTGTYHWFLSRALPIHDKDGRVKHWFGTHTDITEQRAAEEALRQADHNKDRLLATLAHELRNPLAPLRSALEALQLSADESGASAPLYDMMNRQVNQLVRLVDDLLEVSRLTRGKIRLRKEPVLVADVVSNALESTEALIRSAQQHLHVSMPVAKITLHGDNLRLSQILINLLNNAVKYTEPGGAIWLTVSEKQGAGGPEVLISVRDSGKGIDATALPYIFDSFVQLASGEPAGSGLGIGLTIVRTLVEMHGGRVEATSKGPGMGSEFIVSLPIQKLEPQQDSANHEQKNSAFTTTRTLIVDDNVDAARSLGDLLSLLGNEVCIVHSGVAALDTLDEFKPGLILLDIDMPGMDGYEVARRLRLRPDTDQRQVVALTGFGQDEDRKRALAAGFDRHLVKPVDLSTLQSLYTPAS